MLMLKNCDGDPEDQWGVKNLRRSRILKNKLRRNYLLNKWKEI